MNHSGQSISAMFSGRPGWRREPPVRARETANSERPRISIVTPSLNQAAFIEETIRSVLLQDYQNLEYIVVDGGSSDGSVDIIRRYSEHLAYWVSEPDNGQAEAINKGLARATGDILAYLNSDDMYEPGALSRVADWFDRNGDVHLLVGDLAFVDGAGRIVRRLPARNVDLPALLLGNCVGQPAAFFRRHVIDVLGDFREDLSCAMDYDYWIRALLAGLRFGALPVPLARMRSHPASKTSSREPVFFEESQGLIHAALADESLRGVAQIRDRALGRLQWLWGVALCKVGHARDGSTRLRLAWEGHGLALQADDVAMALEASLRDPAGVLFPPRVFNRIRRGLREALGERHPHLLRTEKSYLNALTSMAGVSKRGRFASACGRLLWTSPSWMLSPSFRHTLRVGVGF